MEQTLRCNSLPCRKLLYTEGRAVSTSCSHIFCHECAVTLFRGRRACPACETMLESPDDCIVTVLNPTSSYKASVLAGLTPSTIMEICTRAMGFYQYQSTQEAAFQQVILNKSQEMLERYALDKENMERKAEAEMALLNQKTKALQDELNGEKAKNKELRLTTQSLQRDYEKLRAQLDQARRKAIGSAGMAGTVGEVGDGCYVPGSTHSAGTSAPQPFYPGNSVNSPVPFLRNQVERLHQGNPWQHQSQPQQIQHHPSPTSQQLRSGPLSRQHAAHIARRSETPLPTRLGIEEENLRPLLSPQSKSLRAQGRGVTTPLRAMPFPGYSHTPNQDLPSSQATVAASKSTRIRPRGH